MDARDDRPESLEMPPEMRRETGSMMWLKIEMLEAKVGVELGGESALYALFGLGTISRKNICDNNLCRSPV